MKPLLHILHLEDDDNDASLIEAMLESEGIAFRTTRVETRDAFVTALDKGDVDLVFSDYTLPLFDGPSAIETVRMKSAQLPVILVSGTMGEELAIDCLKSGATDYVLKGRLTRLGPAVRRAMDEVAGRAERDRLAEQFIEAQKMEVVGQLAGGVAHDFNNILAVIMGCSELIKVEIGLDNPVSKFVDEIGHASERAAGLTRQLLVFSRKQTVVPTILDLNVTLLDLEQMLRRLIDEHTELTLIPASGIGNIRADSGYIGQVIMNLVVNARDAMPGGGKITIGTGDVRLDNDECKNLAGSKPGKYTVLWVADTGTGMTKEVSDRIFEAFFTTKALGKGTGLGLATCQTIVNQSGGFISVTSEVGCGTTFQIYLPSVDELLSNPARTNAIVPLARGTETLLVVEDEPSVRNLAQSVLRAQGYTVLTASNGQEALNVARQHTGEPIRLVLSDVIMPLMGGKVMADWLQTSYPDIVILFTSGYTDDAIVREGVLEAGVEFLPKPYTPAILTRKIRELLDAATLHDSTTDLALA